MIFENNSFEAELGIFAIATVSSLLPYTPGIERGVSLTPKSIVDWINGKHSALSSEFYVDPSLFGQSLAVCANYLKKAQWDIKEEDNRPAHRFQPIGDLKDKRACFIKLPCASAFFKIPSETQLRTKILETRNEILRSIGHTSAYNSFAALIGSLAAEPKLVYDWMRGYGLSKGVDFRLI